jgi:hypothetical protein
MLPADGTTLAGLIRRVRATYDPSRAELGEPVAIITVKVVQASPLPVVRALFLYSSGSVDNSYTPLLLSNQRQVRRLCTAQKQGLTSFPRSYPLM